MPKKIDLSIIVVNYNTAQITLNCLKSIKECLPSAGYEIIIVDNASMDNSIELFQKYKFAVINNKKNFGFAYANNQGIRKAKGEYILLLNSDTLVTKGAIDNLFNFAKSNKDIGAVVPKLLNPDGSVQPSVSKLPTFIGALKQYWFGIDSGVEKYIPKSGKPTKVEAAVMAAFLITPQTLKKVGMLNEKYFMYFEDFDYCRNLKKAGLEIYYLPSAEVTHLHGASGKDIADWANQWRRLIPSSKIYHGKLKHHLIFFVTWSSQKWKKYIFRK